MKKEKPPLLTCRLFLKAVLHIFVFIFVTAGPTEALLKPEEIMIVVNTESRESLHLGKLYSKIRHIPESYLFAICTPIQDSITSTQYDELLAAPLRRTINNLQDKGSGSSEYTRFDDDIRRTADVLEKGFMQVVLDNRPELFGPGEQFIADGTASEYIDAFE